MSTSDVDKELLFAFDHLFAKYFDEKDEFSREKTAQDKFWGTYLRTMKDEDETRPKDWDGNTGSILTFTGLFAATVAAFVIESYKSLSRDSGDETILLLRQLLAATTNASYTPTSTPPFSAPLSAVLANALWFVSLIVALACALLATLVQQWSRDYARDIKQRVALDESFESRALNHVYIRMGVDRYGLDNVVSVIVTLVHLAVILFASGLLLFLYPINAAVSGCVACILGGFGSMYFMIGIMPIRDADCPYRTPLTQSCACAYSLLLAVLPNTLKLACLELCRVPVHQLVDRLAQYGRRAMSTLATQRKKDLSTSDTTLERDVLPPSPLPSGSRIGPIKRRKLCNLKSDMTSQRFKFVWQHTSRQLLDADTESLKILFESVLKIILYALDEDRLEYLDHVADDPKVVTGLHVREETRLPESRAELDTWIVIFEFVSLMLRHLFTRKRQRRACREDMNGSLQRYSYTRILLNMLGKLSHSTHHDGSELLAFRVQQTLFHFRWFLLTLEHNDNLVNDSTAWYLTADSDNDVWLLFTFGTVTDFQAFVDLQGLLGQNYALLDRPRPLLSLLNSWKYSTLNAAAPYDQEREQWAAGGTSCLVPLHDDICCRRRDGPIELIAACTILTFLTYFLRACQSDQVPFKAINPLVQYDAFWGQSPMQSWQDNLKIHIEDSDRAPSAEFLTLLRNAGLHHWTVPSDWHHPNPPLDAAQRLFLDHPAGSGSFPTVTAILFELSHCVDMTKGRADPPSSAELTCDHEGWSHPQHVGGESAHSTALYPSHDMCIDLEEVVVDGPSD